MERKILVIYIGVRNLRSLDIKGYVEQLTSKITPSTFEGEAIIAPTFTMDAPEIRVECINPQYITEPELIKQHTEQMQILQERLKEEINIKENE